MNVSEMMDIGLRFNADLAALIERAPTFEAIVTAAALAGVQRGLKSERAKLLMAAVAMAECEHIEQLGFATDEART